MNLSSSSTALLVVASSVAAAQLLEELASVTGPTTTGAVGMLPEW